MGFWSQDSSYLPWDRDFLVCSPPSHSGFYPRLLLFSQQLKPSGFCSTSEKRSGRAWGLAPFLQCQLSPSHLPAMSTWGRPTEQSLGVGVKPPVSKARPIHPTLNLQQFVAIWGDAFSLVGEAGTSSSTFSSLLAPAELVHTSLCGVQAVWLPCDSALWWTQEKFWFLWYFWLFLTVWVRAMLFEFLYPQARMDVEFY